MLIKDDYLRWRFWRKWLTAESYELLSEKVQYQIFGRVPNTSPITGFYFRVQSSRFSTHRNGMLEMK